MKIPPRRPAPSKPPLTYYSLIELPYLVSTHFGMMQQFFDNRIVAFSTGFVQSRFTILKVVGVKGSKIPLT